jgi:hypothetical protein
MGTAHIKNCVEKTDRFASKTNVDRKTKSVRFELTYGPN